MSLPCRWQCVVVCRKTEEKEEWKQPYACPKKGCDIEEGGNVRGRLHWMSPSSFHSPSFFGNIVEMEEPEKVVCDHQQTASNEGPRREGDERKVSEVQEVHQVTYDGKKRMLER